MCSVPGAISTGLSIFGNYMGQKSMAAQAQSQMDSQAKAAFTQMNFAFQDYEMERSGAFDAAVADLDKITLNAMQLTSGVEAAVNENASGRTARLILKDANADTARTKASIRDNYDRKSNEIDINKERTLLSTKDYINNLNASAPQMPSRFSNFVSAAGVALGNFTTIQGQKNQILSTGNEFDFWTGQAKGRKKK